MQEEETDEERKTEPKEDTSPKESVCVSVLTEWKALEWKWSCILMRTEGVRRPLEGH